ncbi:hypothetical protein ABIB57_000065 [Devosia sp. UYZn731]|uniref:hypothetical protein n=1 Tax=Devosia sp. UYZn731 TaxID=3156345 RepID=UPI0033966030
MTRTKKAFDHFRQNFGPARTYQRPPANSDELIQMPDAEGLLYWKDGGFVEGASVSQDIVEQIDNTSEKHLWVVREEDVVYAEETGDWGKSLATGSIKHTNLTGGDLAYCGGELVMLDNQSVLVNGRSGRYGPKSADELKAAAIAFKASGYVVWSCGFDDETLFALPFGTNPVLVP